ncbi:hypothetical protein BCU22_019195 [Vibrio cyclitrophicus]|uniref:hypothetical protein n=1 Tax=Vibrio cyclitrophicus TaxID=47951 RepID=UPI000C84A93F|nr:hypothetical protein [Vibrio cyclitrophicus]PMG07790.1 hypothetical protein BCU99_05705 [Vibrio cyclitrophicus]
MSFNEEGLLVIRNFITEKHIVLILRYLNIVKDKYKKHHALTEKRVENDKYHPNTFSFYSPLCTEVFLLDSLAKVEARVGVKLVPSYSYARIYYNGSNLERHTDRACSEYGISVCLEKDNSSWPLIVIDRCGKEQQINLEVGDAVIFCGMELEHYRDILEGEFHTQMFLFYMPAELSDQEQFLDGRGSLGIPPINKSKTEVFCHE